jgi:hypothetical protein
MTEALQVVAQSNEAGAALISAMRQMQLASRNVGRANVGDDPYEFLDEFLEKRVDPLEQSPDALDEQTMRAIVRNAMTGHQAKQLQDEALASLTESRERYGGLLREYYMRTVLVECTDYRAGAVTLTRYGKITDENPRAVRGQLTTLPYGLLDGGTLRLGGLRTRLFGGTKPSNSVGYEVRPFRSVADTPDVALQILDY